MANVEKKDSRHPGLGFFISFTSGMVTGAGVTLLVLVLVSFALNSMANYPVGTPATPLKGVFYGQVVDALTLDLIPNATVHLCNGKTLDDLVTTVITNASGYYGTTNITLSETGEEFYVSAKATGYYTEPLGQSVKWFSGYETASKINSSIYSISPIKLYRISSDAKMIVQILPKSGGMINIDKSNNYIYQLDAAQLQFNIIMWNHQLNTAAGSPYYGNELQVVVSDPTATVYPVSDIQNEVSLVYTDSTHCNPMRTEHFTITFAREGLTQIALLLKENPYPDFYSFRSHLSLSFTFWVNVTWS